MRICEYIRTLLLDCPLLDGAVISVGYFDERLGGVGIFEEYPERVVREYTDGARVVEKTVKIVMSHIGGMGSETELCQAELAEGICEYLGGIGEYEKDVAEMVCSMEAVSGKAGMQRRELLCRVKYIKGKDD